MRTIQIWKVPAGIDILFVEKDNNVYHVLQVEKLLEEHLTIMNEWLLGGDISELFED